MESNKGEESGEMYSPDEQGEYVPEVGALSFSPRADRCSHSLGNRSDQSATPFCGVCPATQVDDGKSPGVSTSPALSWNAGMVMHVL